MTSGHLHLQVGRGAGSIVGCVQLRSSLSSLSYAIVKLSWPLEKCCTATIVKVTMVGRQSANNIDDFLSPNIFVEGTEG
jgi:precorrin-6B methylase 1